MLPPNVVGPADNTDRYTQLRGVIGDIAGVTSADQLLPSLVKRLPDMVNCDRAIVSLLAPAGGPRDVVLFGSPAPPTAAPDVADSDAAETSTDEDPLVLGEAMRRRRRLRSRVGLSLATAEPGVAPSVPLEIRHTHVLSVREGEELLATIELGREADDPFDEEDVALLDSVAHVVSAGLGRLLARAEADLGTDRSATHAHRLGVLLDVGRELADAVEDDGEWLDRINAAIDTGRFELFAQPMIPLVPGTLLPSFEMLVRMVDDDGELLNPGRFMRVAEDNGLMNRIDLWVISHTLAWMSGADAPTGGLFNINVSAHSLETPSFLSQVEALIEKSGVGPERLIFEITETAALRNLDRARTFIAALKERGCRFALDDFGGGQASFATLKRLPVDAIKIHGQLVRDIESDPVDAAAVSAVKALADTLGLLTIASHVESEGALVRLREIGVDYAQGYHIGRPQPLAFLANMPHLADLAG